MSPIEKTQTIATIQRKKTKKLIKKNMTGTIMILNVLETKSAAASRIAMEMTNVLQKQSMIRR